MNLGGIVMLGVLYLLGVPLAYYQARTGYKCGPGRCLLISFGGFLAAYIVLFDVHRRTPKQDVYHHREKDRG